ncbi:hypothetical protein O0Q50_19770 [Priestia aryabhattai]|uniref:Uncharacterized protein n=1 Tax=Priestia aryabhattai TaxID=412384 RepID=A0AAX6ND35_PRIAR|nr:hypothetical protein [Priestia aryabhattai]MDU9693415.1 hypothetical protein [Priestia aryabhattai]
MTMWIWAGGCILFLLAMGYLADRIAVRRNIEFSPEDGIKNATDAEQIYVENYLNETKNTNNNMPL